MNRRLHESVLFLVCFLLMINSLVAQKRAMTLVDMLEVPQLSDPQLSPNGKQLLFVLNQADWTANRRIGHIFRQQVGEGEPIQMTQGSSSESSPRWSPDGSLIAFLGRRPEESEKEGSPQTQIFLIRISGGEAWQFSHHPTSVSSITWAPDGNSLYFLASDEKSAEQKERDKLQDDVFAFDENYQHTHLWKIEVEADRETKLTDGDYSITGYRLGRRGRKLVVARAPNPLLGYGHLSELHLIDNSGSGWVRLTHNDIRERSYDLSPDGGKVLFTAASNEAFERYYNNNLFVVPTAGGKPEMLLPDLRHGIDSAVWSSDGDSIYMLCNMGANNDLFELNLADGVVQRKTSGEHSLGGWTFFPKSRSHVVTRSHPFSPGDIHLLGPAGGELVQASRVFDHLEKKFKLPRMERVQWKGSDGVEVEGILTYPVDYQQGRRYPLAVITHGGPRSSDKMRFSSWSRYRTVLAAKGYAVLQPNYRGSTGYGDAFLRDMVGHYFNQAHQDVMAGVDHLIERGIADPDRMVKMGWSAGGHMTNKIITFTDRFKAAASGAGASNWISMYAQSDVRSNRTPWFGGTPWQKDAPIEVYWNNSQLKDAWKVRTPTIFLVGEEDARVPMPQSVEMYRALKSNGVDTHLYVAPREPHGWRELRHELFKMNVELDWFEKHAMKRSYEWEKAPTQKEL